PYALSGKNRAVGRQRKRSLSGNHQASLPSFAVPLGSDAFADSGEVPNRPSAKSFLVVFICPRRKSTPRPACRRWVRTTCARWAEPKMIPSTILIASKAEPLEGPERLPAEIDSETLRKYFTVTEADLKQVELCQESTNRIGFGVQLCTLRRQGYFLDD